MTSMITTIMIVGNNASKDKDNINDNNADKMLLTATMTRTILTTMMTIAFGSNCHKKFCQFFFCKRVFLSINIVQ